MSMIQKIEIDGKQVPFKVSAAIPRIYRIKFHRDIYKDLDALCEDLEADKAGLCAKLHAVGYDYDPQRNQFV